MYIAVKYGNENPRARLLLILIATLNYITRKCSCNKIQIWDLVHIKKSFKKDEEVQRKRERERERR